MTTLALLLFLSATKDAGASDPWNFDGATAAVSAKGDTRDALSAAALQQLGLRLEGSLSLKVSALAAFSGRLRTTATCRKISGTARHLEEGKVELEARSPDCNAQPLGLPLSVSGTLTPR